MTTGMHDKHHQCTKTKSAPSTGKFTNGGRLFRNSLSKGGERDRTEKKENQTPTTTWLVDEGQRVCGEGGQQRQQCAKQGIGKGQM